MWDTGRRGAVLHGIDPDSTFGRCDPARETVALGLVASAGAALRRIPGIVVGYVDLHVHVLPGIDDGPSDALGAMAMMRAAVAAGIGH